MKRLLSLLFNLRNNIRESYKRNESLIRVSYDDREILMLETNYYFLTYNDYDRLRILMINVLFLIIKDIKMKRRKYKKK